MDVQTADFAALPTIGVGLWGSVHDLGDGTVGKLTRRRCAGIGDGRKKIQREIAVLQALQTCPIDAGLSTPIPVTAGERDHPDTPLWLQVTKVGGQVRRVAEIERLPAQESRAVAAALGRAAVSIHRLLSSVALECVVPDTVERFDDLAQELHGDFEAEDYLSHLRQVHRSLGLNSPSLIHGDLNISNLLFEGYSVISIVDFAETRRGFYEEDLASIITELPALRSPLVDAYRSLSRSDIDEKRLDFALAMECLATFVISGRLGLTSESAAARRRLNTYLSLVGQHEDKRVEST